MKHGQNIKPKVDEMLLVEKNNQTDPVTMPLHTDALFIPSLHITRWHDSFESTKEGSGAGLTALRAL